MHRLESALKADPSLAVQFTQGHFQISLAKPNRRFWSPCLQLEIIAAEDDNSHLKGIWGPHPDVWTVYTFAAAGLAFLVTIAAMWGLSQMTLKKQATALYAVPVCLGAACTLYGSAFVGQRLAHDHIELIQIVVAKALDLNPDLL